MNNKLTAYVGTYTKGDSKGIYKFTLDLETGKIEDIALAAVSRKPYLLKHRQRQQTYLFHSNY